ncbi:MAG: chromosomal replication initiator protein DnaA [Acidobacteriota bacterium]|nr:MAG: chromosomal replication initiator protein DnaA [Acidobacteriota bacterium]
MHLWEEILASLREKVTVQNFDIWFRPTSLFRQDKKSKSLTVLVPNKHFRYWLTENYSAVLDEVLREQGLEGYSIRFVVEEEEEGQKPEQPVTKPTNGKGEGEAAGSLNSKYSFDSFVVGFSNQFAHAAALAVAEQPSCAYNPLFIYGGVGLGKTHLMHAIGQHILTVQKRTRLVYMSSECFMNELIHSIRYDRMIQFREKYRNIDVLLMDDIQFLAGKERTQEEFFHTFNSLYDSQKQIIISSDSQPKEIPTLEERLHSRFEWGLIADIQPPDLETKVAILRKKANAQGVEIPEDVEIFIASNIKSNVRELEGALVRLVAYSSLTGEKISIELAQRVLRNIAENQARIVTIDQIQRRVAEHYSIKVTELKAKNNARRVSEPRQVAMFLSKELTQTSLSEIGKEFGGKHHTTVLHAIRKVDEMQKRDAKVRAMIDRLAEAMQ